MKTQKKLHLNEFIKKNKKSQYDDFSDWRKGKTKYWNQNIKKIEIIKQMIEDFPEFHKSGVVMPTFQR